MSGDPATSGNPALAWLAHFRPERAQRVVGEATLRWREHRRAQGRYVDELLSGLAQQLVEMGIPMLQCSISLLPLHPEVYAFNMVWSRGRGVSRHVRTHEFVAEITAERTPMAAIKQGSDAIRCRFGADDPVAARWSGSPPLRDMASRGGTEFFIMPLPFSDGRRSFFWALADRPGGFTDREVAALDELTDLLALRAEVASWEEATSILLETYLGANAAGRVLSGAFKRGTGEVLEAVLWYCDMRGFTSLVDTRPMAEVIPLLNRYFEVMAGAVEDAGGEVLKFIGDAMLAVFHVDERGPGEPCRRALDAATVAIDALDGLSGEKSGTPAIRSGIALHVGQVMYGNIGARARLDFTVIGPAVNETARVESLCKELGAPLLVTDAFRRASGAPALVSLGEHTLRGVASPVELHTLARFRRG